MSNFDEIWAKTVAQNPSLANPRAKVTITVEQFKRALRQVCEAGYERGKEIGRAAAEHDAKHANPFGKLFGL